MTARRVPTLITLLLGCLLMAPPASATHGGIHPTFREERVYFHCTGMTKVYNVNYWTLSEFVTTWNTTPPSQSVEEGAGCGGYEYGGFNNRAYDVAFQGYFVGNLRDVTVEIHQLLLGNVRDAATETLRLQGWIDGVPLFPVGTQPSDGRTVTVTPVPSESGASERFRFTITNLGYANDVYDAEGKLIDVETGGAALEDGDGEQWHHLELYIGVHGNTLDTDVKSKLGVWAWDTTEVPSGITFNPTTPETARVAADLPVFGS